MSKQKVTIIGAGLAGSLLAIYLAKRGIAADVYESRNDLRTAETAAGRSINLALSNRGIAALKEIGLDEYLLAEAVPMHGRMIHAVDGETKFLPYSGRKGEYINSISRYGLNIALINEAEKYKEVKFYFNERCVACDIKTGELTVSNPFTNQSKIVSGGTVIGTDGAGSVLRNAMQSETDNFKFSQVFLDHRYIELSIPPAADGDFQIEKNALHIWARKSFLMIALPNFDGSFTCTLFLAGKGANSFESIFTEEWFREEDPAQLNEKRRHPLRETAEKNLLDFFQANFADAIPLMPTLTEDFFTNPVGYLGTIKCFPWNFGGKSLLLGDSAHAIVPFYGQGMNASFEDCRILNQLIETHGTNWETVFDEFTASRKPNADAIAQMAEENFYEMRDAVADPIFQRKRELETKLEQTFPDYYSKYSMVTFREDLPYKIAEIKGNAQDKLLMEICAGIENVSEINLNDVMEKVKLI